MLTLLGYVAVGIIFLLLNVGFKRYVVPKIQASNSVDSLPKPNPKLSEVSKELLKEYNALPEESRPFPEIASLLVALDEKHSLDAWERRNHFNQNWLPHTQKELYYSGFEFTWSPVRQNCSHNNCKFKEYYRLHKNIAAVSRTLDDKNRALLESENRYATDMIAELESRLRDEAKIQQQFVKEFKELG